MKAKQHFVQALGNIFVAKLRSFLAVLGILVGTASVVALISGGQLATQAALDVFKALGTDLLSVSLYDEASSNENTPANTLDYQQAKRMQGDIPGVINVAPYTSLYADISYQGRKLEGSIVAAEDSLRDIVKITMQEGGFISFLDDYEKFVVVGHEIAEQIKKYSQDSLVGKQLWLGEHIYTIIGVAKEWPENLFFNQDLNKSVVIPILGVSAIQKKAKINNLIFLIEEEVDIDQLISHIEAYISRSAPSLKSYASTAKQFIASMEQQGKIYTLLLGLIGGISLLVGGIGVMNVMLVSVAERRREIGIRMAIGARRRDIQQLFLFESVVLALLGGVIGVILGVMISYFIALFAGWQFSFFVLPSIVGFLVSASTGIFFGFYPAYRASQLDPIEALRSE